MDDGEERGEAREEEGEVGSFFEESDGAGRCYGLPASLFFGARFARRGSGFFGLGFCFWRGFGAGLSGELALGFDPVGMWVAGEAEFLALFRDEVGAECEVVLREGGRFFGGCGFGGGRLFRCGFGGDRRSCGLLLCGGFRGHNLQRLQRCAGDALWRIEELMAL